MTEWRWIMDAIEKGFDALLLKVQEYEEKKEKLKGAVVKEEAGLLARKVKKTVGPVISKIGLVMLERENRIIPGRLKHPVLPGEDDRPRKDRSRGIPSGRYQQKSYRPVLRVVRGGEVRPVCTVQTDLLSIPSGT